MREYLHFADGWEDRLRRSGLATFDALMTTGAGERLDKAKLERWRERWRLQVPGVGTMYLKRFTLPPLKRQFERWREGHAGWSTARVEFENARALAAAGIAAVEPLAVGEHMSGPLERASFILLKEVNGESLERWLPRVHAEGPRPTAGRSGALLVSRLAGFAASFHRAGFVHRDLYLAHIFIEESGETATFRLIDLQRVFRPQWRGRRWVVKDLAALEFSTPHEMVSRTARLRFLARYVRGCNRFGSARDLARLVARKVGRMRCRDQNRDR